MDLPYSDACLVQAYPGETSEAFCDGHRVSFEFFGGVPRSILYDNTKLAVARILGDGTRQRTRMFSELQSHYLFADRFGRPGKGNDKGKVKGLVGYARRNFMVPIPHALSFAELNAQLLECCRRRLNDRFRGHDDTIGERLVKDREALLPLPPAPYDACEKRPAWVSSLSLVLVQPPPGRIRFVSGSSVAAPTHARYASAALGKKSKERKPISGEQRETDDRLRRELELETADPKTFDRLVSPLFRSQRTDGR